MPSTLTWGRYPLSRHITLDWTARVLLPSRHHTPGDPEDPTEVEIQDVLLHGHPVEFTELALRARRFQRQPGGQMKEVETWVPLEELLREAALERALEDQQ